MLKVGNDKNINKDSIFSACLISKFLTGILDLDEDINKNLCRGRYLKMI